MITFTNPLLPGMNPDPSVCRVGADYFLVTSSFEYFPGVPLYHSRDLVNWRLIGHVLSRPSQLSFERWRPSGGIFAATIRYHQGTFYMVTTNMSGVTPGRGNFYVHTRDPFGEWSDPVWLDQGGINPSLFFDDDGRAYLTSNWFEGFPPPPELDPLRPSMGIQQCEINPATGALIGEPRRIWPGTGGRFPEAPHLYKRQGLYYLLLSEGGTELNHMVTLARSETPWGPWEACPHNPVLTHRSVHSPFQAIGHADLIEAHDGTWWLVCLGVRPQGDHPPAAHLGRETFLAPVLWDEEGWPHLGLDGPLPIRMEMEAPALTPHPWPAASTRDDFKGPTLSPHWTHLGTPVSEHYRLGGSGLTLTGSASRLQDGPPVTFLGRRQEHLRCTLSTRLNFEPGAEGEEAGMTIWMNPRHHYDLFLTRREGQRGVAVRCRIGDLEVQTAFVPVADGPVTLRVVADPLRYALSLVLEDGTSSVLDTALARYLAPEVAGGCTGVFFALYAVGSGDRPALFEWVDLQPDRPEA